MVIPGPQSLDYLLQTDVLEGMFLLVGKEQWQPLYVSRDDDSGRFGLWCALLDDTAVDRALNSNSWDLLIGDGKPGFSQSWHEEGELITEYHPYGGRDGVRALVHHRSFHGAYPSYCEIDQEFRLYHDLAHDPDRGLFLTFDDSGREIEVIRIGPHEITARLKYLRQYQAGTQQNLAVYVDSVRYSTIPLENVGERHDSERNENGIWSRHVAACDFHREYSTFSRVLFKVILRTPRLEKAGIWPFDEDEEPEVSFIIGVNEDGENVEYTSDPDKLGNYFGANPEAPNYLTPIYFRPEVLAKYYAEPERYTVSDGHLSCLGLWICQIDNDLESNVVVFLGDLGRDLPYEERLHWRQFNIPPERGISETNFQRSFLVQFTEPKAADLVFRDEYKRFSADWSVKFGWPFFLPLAPGDAHLADIIRIPVTNSQGEMDEQVLCLTKLLVDSLNERELAKAVTSLPEGAKGIAKLDAFFQASGYEDGKAIVQFLKDLQLLRSTGSGHRKGSAYDETVAKLGVDPKRKPDAVAHLLEEGIAMIRALRFHYIDGEQNG